MKVIPYTNQAHIKQIWLANQEHLGRLYPNFIKERITNNQMFCCLSNNIVTGLLSYKLDNKRNEIVIDLLVTLKEYRSKGIASFMLQTLCNELQSLIYSINMRLSIEVYYDSPYTKFFEHRSTSHEIRITKNNTKLIKYYLDSNKLLNV